MTPQELDYLSVNTIRFLSVDAIEKANSGHPGLPLGAAPMAYVLWAKFLRHNPANPQWPNRDRFVLSAGHGSALLYSLLHLTGYEVSLEQLQQFRQKGSVTPGHPERGVTPGVEITTGPLGQGFAAGVGMAMAEAYLATRYNRPDHTVIDHYTYGLVSDGDLMEGVAAEAASLAGHLKLGKLIYLYDDNRITLAASTSLSFTEDRARRFESYGWHVQTVKDGNDLAAIEEAIRAAQEEEDGPSLIAVRTHIGYGSPHKQDTFDAHGSPLGAEEVKLTKENLGWPVEPTFHIPVEVKNSLGLAVDNGRVYQRAWESAFALYARTYADRARELANCLNNEVPANWHDALADFTPDENGMATRAASGKVLNAISGALPGMIGGSADLNPSTKTDLKGEGDFQHPATGSGDLQGTSGGVWSYAGRNIQFGVREHAMGAIMNGMAVHGGVIPFGGTFLTFADYMRPSIRLAALMELNVVYVFTHDSIGVGEDGPTHQPVEQVASLRAIPGLIVIRPGDANETNVAWQIAIERKDRPVALILSRQSVPTLDRERFAAADGVRRGAYVLADTDETPEIILIASGSEVGLMVKAYQELTEEGVAVRCVSMPSWELFEAQERDYRDSVLIPTVKARLAIEAGATQGWHRYVGTYGEVIGIDRFGASAPGGELMEEYGFTVDAVCRRAVELL